MATNTAAVPTEAMQNGDFSQLLGTNPFYSTPQVIRDPLTGQPFPGNIIPANRLSPNGIALMKLYPLADARVPAGAANLIQTATTRRTSGRTTSGSTTAWATTTRSPTATRSQNWMAIDAFRGTFPFARTDWDRPNRTMNVNWAWTISNNLINEASYAYSIDQVFINVFTESGLHKRSRTGVNYPYIFPGKEIEDKIPTINIDTVHDDRRRPVPVVLGGADPPVDGHHDVGEGPAHDEGGRRRRVLGRGRLRPDQRELASRAAPTTRTASSTFRDSSSARSGLGIADMALGLFTNYAEIGERARTNWRALATDIFVQDSWRPNDKLTIEGGVRYAIWPPWYSTTNNIANFDPRFYDTANAAVINPSTGRIVSGPRYNGIVLPGDGFVGEGNDLKVASDPAVQALFRGEPRGLLPDALRPLRAARRHVVRVERQDRPARERRRLPQPRHAERLDAARRQPAVPADGHRRERQRRQPRRRAFANDLPFGMQGQDVVFKLPASYMWSVGVQRQLPWKIVLDVTYVGRRGLYLQRERNINQLLPGTLQANPGVNIAALRPYKGYGALRVSENSGDSKYNSLQVSAERRYANGFKLSVAYTYGKSFDNGSDKRNVLWNTYDDSNFWGPSSYDRTHVLVVSYIYDLPFWRDQSTLLRNLLGGWQISGVHVHPVRDAVLDHPDQRHRRRGRRQHRPARRSRGRHLRELERAVLGRQRPRQQLLVQPGRVRQPGRRQVRQLDAQHPAEPAATSSGTSRCSRTSSLGGTHRLQFRAEVFNFINHPNLSGPNTDITNPNFGRIITKDGSRRDIQLALRYYF